MQQNATSLYNPFPSELDPASIAAFFRKSRQEGNDSWRASRSFVGVAMHECYAIGMHKNQVPLGPEVRLKIDDWLLGHLID